MPSKRCPLCRREFTGAGRFCHNVNCPQSTQEAAYQEGERRGRERAADVAEADALFACAMNIRALPDEPPPEPKP